MINILFHGNNIVLKGDIVNDWELNMFFTINLGFSVDYKTEDLYYPFSENGFRILINVISYLNSKKLDFELDQTINEYIQIITAEKLQYSNALEQVNNPEKIDPPDRLVRILKNHQVKAFHHAVSAIHAANFSVPGSGKTTVVYSTYAYLQRLGIVEKILVIGPNSSFMPWEEEADLCFGQPIKSARLSGSRAYRESIYFQKDKFELFLCFYQTLANDLAEITQLLLEFDFLVVIDESHNIKKFSGGVWSSAALAVSRYAKRRIILSGTPVPNSLEDLWTQFTFLWPGEYVLGNKEQYKNRASKNESLPQIKNQVQPFIYRVTKDDLDLPKPIFRNYSCEMSPYQRKIYEALSHKFLNELGYKPEEKTNLRYWRRAKMIRLIQTASNPSLLGKYSDEFDIPPLSGKNVSIIDLIDKYSSYETPTKFIEIQKLIKELISSKKKVLVWTSFIQNILMFEKLLKSMNYEVFKIYGSVPKDENSDIDFNREQQIRDFKQSKRPSILLANPAACAESISLHKYCHDAIYLDRTFNCGEYLQSLNRIHRLGLGPNEHVTYHIFTTQSSIDETISNRLLEKEEIMMRILRDDLPIGEFEVDENMMAASENEENVDFEETIRDLRKQLGN